MSTSCILTKKKQNFKAYLKEGKRLSEEGLLRKALKTLKLARSKKPRHPEVNLYMGSIYIKLERYKEAKSCLKNSLKKMKKSPELYFLLGEAFRGLDNYAEAIFYYRKAKDIDPKNIRNLKALAWSYYKIRYYKEALKTVRPLVKKKVKDEQVYIIMARVLCKLRSFKKAFAILNQGQAITSIKYKPYFISIRGDVYFGLGKIIKAKKLYQRALKIEPLLSGALLGLGRCLIEEGKTAQAVVYMERARRLKPKIPEIYFLLAQSYEELNKKKSLKYYKKFRRLAHADPEYLDILINVKKKMTLLQDELKRPL